MQTQNDIPLLERGLPQAWMWNAMAKTVNVLRKINLGPGLSGSMGPGGVCIGLAPAPSVPAYPYGDNHPWGITWEVSALGQVTVKIWNGMYMYAGVITASWWTAESEEGFSLPDRAYQELVIGDGSWTENTGGTMRRVGISHKLDTVTNTSSIVASSDLGELSTHTQDPEPLRYILTPLYILEQSRPDSESVWAATRIYMHFVGGIQVLQLYG